MKLSKFLLHTFEATDRKKDIHAILVQPNSIFLEAKILHDGIYVFYLTTELVADFTQEEQFKVVKTDETVPEGFEFVSVLDVVVEAAEPGTQAVVLFPLFKKVANGTERKSRGRGL